MSSSAKTLKLSKSKRGRPVDHEKDVLIFKVATDLFLKQGYAATSMEQIAKTAKISKITLYGRFPDKDTLFRSVIQHKCEEYTLPSDFMPFADVPMAKALTAIGVKFAALVMSDEAIQMHRIIEAESMRHPKISLLFYDAAPAMIKKGLRELFVAWKKRGVIKTKDIDKAIEHYLCLVKGEAHMRLLLNLPCSRSKNDIEKHVKSCVELIVNSYGA